MRFIPHARMLSDLEDKIDEGCDEGQLGTAGKRPCMAAALRINNNGFSDISGLFEAAGRVVREPAALRWLDLSFNAIAAVAPEVAQFEECSVIYMHANGIKDVRTGRQRRGEGPLTCACAAPVPARRPFSVTPAFVRAAAAALPWPLLPLCIPLTGQVPGAPRQAQEPPQTHPPRQPR